MRRREESVSPPEWILRWSSLHAVVLLAAVFVGWRENSIRLVLALGSLSILLFLSFARQKLDRRDLWNRANFVSLFRWVGLVGLGLAAPKANGFLIFGGGILFMCLDTLDGWLARRQGTQTEFSEYLDKEIDSLFLLIVCLGLAARDVVGAWILIIGLSRYWFVIALLLLRPARSKERRSSRARLVYSAVLVVLLALFLPLRLPPTWPALGCLAVLLFSFFLDLRQIFFGERDGGKPPVLTNVRGNEDIRVFFDALAPVFRDPHGPPEKLLRDRVGLIRKHSVADKRDLVLEIGCGRGDHLLALLEPGQRGLGIDLSPAMIREARAGLRLHPAGDRVVFFEGDAANLAVVGDSSVGLAFAVGAFEHMLDKPAVLGSLFRVLRPGGCFICLSPNGEFLWYSRLAPWLRVNTRHLSSDVFLSRPQFAKLLRLAGFSEPSVSYWRFIPRGDIPRGWALFLGALDLAGRLMFPSKLRGGILVKAVKHGPLKGGHKDPGDGSEV